MKRTATALLIVGAVLAAASCGLFQNKVTFTNLSTLTIHVSPNQQNWEAFDIAPGETKSVIVDMDAISFVYDHLLEVFPEFGEDGTHIVFRNRFGP
jgi:hypothetical protein